MKRPAGRWINATWITSPEGWWPPARRLSGSRGLCAPGLVGPFLRCGGVRVRVNARTRRLELRIGEAATQHTRTKMLCRCNTREIYEACCSPTISVATGLLVTPNASYRRTSAAAKIPHSIKPRRHRSHKESTTSACRSRPRRTRGHSLRRQSSDPG